MRGRKGFDRQTENLVAYRRLRLASLKILKQNKCRRLRNGSLAASGLREDHLWEYRKSD